MNQNRYRSNGIKPVGLPERTAAVKSAVGALEKIGAAFTVTDIAERSGVSRATIYRSAELRQLIGARGNIERTVPAEAFNKMEARCAQQRAAIRKLRQELKELEASWEVIRARAVAAEVEVETLRSETKDLAARLAKRSGGSLPTDKSLHAVASSVGPVEAKRIRRQLARLLHPDLFAADPSLASVANELLKMVNVVCKAVES